MTFPHGVPSLDDWKKAMADLKPKVIKSADRYEDCIPVTNSNYSYGCNVRGKPFTKKWKDPITGKTITTTIETWVAAGGIQNCASVKVLNNVLNEYEKHLDDITKNDFSVNTSLLSIINHYIHIVECHKPEEYKDAFAICPNADNKKCIARKRLYLAKEIWIDEKEKDNDDDDKKMQKKAIQKKKDILRDLYSKKEIYASSIIKYEYLDLAHYYFKHKQEIDDNDQSLNKFGSIVDDPAIINSNNDDIKVNAQWDYSFGLNFVWHETQDIDNNIYIKPNYSNIKDELTQNKARCNITIEQFDITKEKAIQLLKTDKGKGLKATEYVVPRGVGDLGGLFSNKTHNLNSLWNITPQKVITMDHIISLLIYCNYFAVQSDYKKAARKGADDTIDDVIKRVQDCAYFYKLIKESIVLWGNNCDYKSNKLFYHGMNCQLKFNTFTPTFLTIFSTSTTLKVSAGFARDKGFVLALSPSPASIDPYFDVKWLSGYVEQDECLFSRAINLNIIDIRLSPKDNIFKTNNSLNLNSLILCDNIFSEKCASFFIANIGIKKIETENRLIALINQYNNNNNNIDNQTDDMKAVSNNAYINTCFDCLIDKKFGNNDITKLKVIKSEYELLSSDLQILLNELVAKKGKQIEFVGEHTMNMDNIFIKYNKPMDGERRRDYNVYVMACKKDPGYPRDMIGYASNRSDLARTNVSNDGLFFCQFQAVKAGFNYGVTIRVLPKQWDNNKALHFSFVINNINYYANNVIINRPQYDIDNPKANWAYDIIRLGPYPNGKNLSIEDSIAIYKNQKDDKTRKLNVQFAYNLIPM